MFYLSPGSPWESTELDLSWKKLAAGGGMALDYRKGWGGKTPEGTGILHLMHIYGSPAE